LTTTVNKGTLLILSLLLLGIPLSQCGIAGNSPEELFDANFQPFPNLVIDLDQVPLDTTPVVKTFLAYRNKEYEKAFQYSTKITDLPEDDPIQLYRAVCKLAMSDAHTAEYLLLPLSEKNWEYRDAANWYLALANLKQGKVSATKSCLKLLTDRSTYIRNEASVLMRKVDNLPLK